MKKYFFTGLFGTVLGLGAIDGADAALVSRGFLDEALDNYATIMALDLKANQSDLTALSDIVGTPANLKYSYVIERNLTELFGVSYDGSAVFPTNDISELIRLNYTSEDFPGIRGVVRHLFNEPRNFIEGEDKYPLRLSTVFSDYESFYYNNGNDVNFSLYDFLLEGGKMDGGTVYGLSKITTEIDKIGDVPEGYDNLGAALSAVKGIAEEAKQLAQQAIPDPKEVGESGKFVLTVDIVGDNATYKWEQIDRAETENSEQSE